MTRHFFQQTEAADKSWSITIVDNSFTISQEVNYGAPKTINKSFDSPISCNREAANLISKKLEEGYEEIPLHIPGVPVNTLHSVAMAMQQQAAKLEIYQSAGSEALMELICTIGSLKQLRVNQVTVVPASIQNLQLLESLYIDNSPALKIIPDTIGELTHLHTLSIGHTGIENLPATISGLVNLQFLTIHNNKKLHGLPSAIGQLKQLKTLTVFYNRDGDDITPFELPASLGDLHQLERLDLSDNNLTGLPNSLAQLQQLEFLQLRNNKKLTSIPPFVLQLPLLYLLDMECCQVSQVPFELCSFKELEHVKLTDNNITDIPAAILEEGWKAIKPYLEGNSIKNIPLKSNLPVDPAERLVKEYQAAHGAVVPAALKEFILSGSLSAHPAFSFHDTQHQRKANFIKDIASRMDGMADQLIRITVGNLANDTEPIGFADVAPLDDTDDYTYQLIIFPKPGFPKTGDQHPSPVYLVKYKGYPSEEEEYDEEFEEETEQGENEQETNFDCSIHKVADSFTEFIATIQ